MTSFIRFDLPARYGPCALVTLLLAVSGCGGSGDAPRTAAPPANSPPIIGGSPPGAVESGSLYQFVPNATDGDGDNLTFSVANPPPWADFDSTTGELSGTPDDTDVGSYGNIIISVSDGTASDALSPFTIDVAPPQRVTATVSWDAPTQDSDGSSLSDLDGYRVYFGTSSGTYDQMVTVSDSAILSIRIIDLEPGRYFFAVTAIDDDGNESVTSSEVERLLEP